MESENTILALAALAQPTRLEAFRLLVRHEPEGLAAGDIGIAMGAAGSEVAARSLSLVVGCAAVEVILFPRSGGFDDALWRGYRRHDTHDCRPIGTCRCRWYLTDIPAN